MSQLSYLAHDRSSPTTLAPRDNDPRNPYRMRLVTSSTALHPPSSTALHPPARPQPPAAALLEEADAIHEATGNPPPLYTSLILAAWRGQQSRASELMDASIQDAPAQHQDRVVYLAEYTSAVLYNGLGQYPAALAAARWTCQHEDLGLLAMALTELVEASVRSGHPDVAATALRRLQQRTPAGGTDWALGMQARSRALLSDGADADALYRAALERLASSGITLHLARAQLVYGEWLRREHRRVNAREQLRAAHTLFSRIGAGGFADRARRELLATGEKVRKRTVDTRDQLTAQEAQIARLAAIGDTNVEIGAHLFLSPRTVEWHLRKVFTKLGLTSRKQLRTAVSDATRPAVPAW